MPTCKIVFDTAVNHDRDGTDWTMTVRDVVLDGQLVDDRAQRDEILGRCGLDVDARDGECEIWVFGDNPLASGAADPTVRIGPEAHSTGWLLGHFDDGASEPGEFEVEFPLPTRMTQDQLEQHEAALVLPCISTRVVAFTHEGESFEGDVLVAQDGVLSITSEHPKLGSRLLTEHHFSDGAVHFILVLN